MKRKRNTAGFSMAELLVVVAIIVVLAAVAFIAVANHARSLEQLEYNTIAKEIFISAQNHLSSVDAQGYLGRISESDKYGKKETGDKEIYYFVVNGGTATGGGSENYAEIFDLMLPFGSIDETVRLGGSYVIRYQPSSATVLDVYYSNPNGRYGVSFFGDGYTYDKLQPGGQYYGSGNESARRNPKVIGYYGEESGALKGERLEVPSYKIINAERLQIEITDPNTTNSLKLIVKSAKSESTAKTSFLLKKDGADQTNTRLDHTSGSKIYTVTLDSVTESNMHFGTIKNDSIGNGVAFVPGEDIVIQVVAYSNSTLTNIAYASEQTTNSLFADPKSGSGAAAIDGSDYANKIAGIANIRHLENLSTNISDIQDGTIETARQISDLDWNEFCSKISGSSTIVYGYSDADGTTGSGCFYPVTPEYEITYEGQRHIIKNIKVSCAGAAGLFGTVSAGDSNTITDIELIDFSIASSGSDTVNSTAGALAGTLNKTAVQNVLVRNTAAPISGQDNITAAASGSAGGLIGEMTDGGVDYCAAAVTVSGAATSGGLIGKVGSGTTAVSGCYSGGVTEHAGYYMNNNGKPAYDASGALTNGKYNISGTTAGGLIGDFSGASIVNSYSTCSVKGTAAAGGLLGQINKGTVTNCYCTGLVYPNFDTQDQLLHNAFVGVSGSSVVFTSNKFFYIINEVKKDNAFLYKEPGGHSNDSANQLDYSVDTYDGFVGAPGKWKNAVPYDPTLKGYYQNKYNLKTVERLENDNTDTGWSSDDTKKAYYVRTHYGDWPAPEIFVINTQ